MRRRGSVTIDTGQHPGVCAYRCPNALSVFTLLSVHSFLKVDFNDYINIRNEPLTRSGVKNITTDLDRMGEGRTATN
jgi:hypothetical protein